MNATIFMGAIGALTVTCLCFRDGFRAVEAKRWWSVAFNAACFAAWASGTYDLFVMAFKP